ncbi:ArsC/Spx/MgsR family protein [Lactococcus petauri]|uniref:ArsC/Spx/MgsR family protein n=1 Tax=Lactococcus petauri TaxID=1940789 RepID=UPI0031FEF573
MITIYYNKSDASSKRVLKWMDIHQVAYESYSIKKISKEDLVKILSLTDKGIKEILKQKKCSSQNQVKIEKLYGMNMDEALSYITFHPELLCTPIIFSDNKILVGYNEVEIRQFIPRRFRKRYF